MNFYGRETELKKLNDYIAGTDSILALVYGRRHVGKSELIRQSLRQSNVRSIYYKCKQTSELNNTESLSALLSDVLQLPKFSFASMEELLEYLFRTAVEQPMILVLDEYPYLRSTIKGLDSIIQSLTDQYREHSSLKLILCGFYIEIMKSLQASDSPLYGRCDLTIDLKPMDYYDSAKFYPSFNDEDKVRLYSVFGGIPYYNRLIDETKSVQENIISLIASDGARLENEVSMNLRSEMSKVSNAIQVFEALAKGYSRYSDILSQSHVSSSPALSDALNFLMRMELVQKEAPINDENNKRKTGYYISDPLSLFYYRYIYRFASQMSVMDPDVFFEKYILQDFETKYVPKMFEMVSRQYLIRQNRLGKIEPMFHRIGKYYFDDPVTKTNGEFDIVTIDPNGYVFYEAKFHSTPLNDAVIEKEIAQVKSSGLLCDRYGFFSRSGFKSRKRNDCVFYSLTDLYR